MIMIMIKMIQTHHNIYYCAGHSFLGDAAGIRPAGKRVGPAPRYSIHYIHMYIYISLYTYIYIYIYVHKYIYTYYTI